MERQGQMWKRFHPQLKPLITDVGIFEGFPFRSYNIMYNFVPNAHWTGGQTKNLDIKVESYRIPISVLNYV